MSDNIPTILNYEAARATVCDYDAVLSIYDDSKYSVSPPFGCQFLSLMMWDVTPAKFYGAPAKLDIYRKLVQARAFFDSLRPDDRLLIHCKWGVSRSAALGVMYLMQRQGVAMADAVDVLREQRDHIKPNWYYLAVIENIING